MVTKDDTLLATLEKRRAEFLSRIDARIGRVRQRINERWKKMPVATLTQAKLAEAQRLRDCGLDPAYIRRSIAQDLNCVLSTQDPSAASPKDKTWYNAATDTEWNFRDVGGHREIDMQWAIGITSASRFNPIRLYQRRRTLEAK